MVSNNSRLISNAYGIKDKFEVAYAARMAEIKKIGEKVPEIEDKASYGDAYYNKAHLDKMKVGYVHPYHTTGSPIHMSGLYYMKNVF